MSTKTVNQCYLGTDGIINCIWQGDQSTKSVLKIGKDLQPFIAQIRESGKEVFILCDITRLGKIPLAARITGGNMIRELDFDRCAIYGNYFLLKGLVEAVILASGCKFKTKYFIDEKSARRWLLQKTS